MNIIWTHTALICGICLVHVIGLYAFFVHKPREWASELKTSWKKVLLISSLGYIVAIGVSLVVFKRFSFFQEFSATLIYANTVYIFIQSVFTDFQVRRVDKRIQRWILLVSVVLNFLVVHSGPDSSKYMAVWFICILAPLIILFLNAMGDADVRAIMFLSASFFPMLGLNLFLASFIWILIVVAIYTVVMYIRQPSDEKKSIKGLLGLKLTGPMVPLILAPYVIFIPMVQYWY